MVKKALTKMQLNNFNICYDPTIPMQEVREVGMALVVKTPIDRVQYTEMPILEMAYESRRNQYDGQKLLNACITRYNLKPFLWLLTKDLFVPPMNFIFGLACKGEGGLVSFYRLPSMEMKVKESLHETGHILGLEHCKNKCVMQYSNSLKEALRKPAEFCEECKNKLQNLINPND